MTTCKDCKFFVNDAKNADLGSCRRMPPQLTIMLVPGALGQPQLADFANFPNVKVDSWCGEFKLRLIG